LAAEAGRPFWRQFDSLKNVAWEESWFDPHQAGKLRIELEPRRQLEPATVLEGEVEFEVAGQVHRPQAGEELLIPAGAVHSARNVGTRTARWLYGYRCRG
jgi:glyoxylate utilization-related uncharacterized protein